MYSFYLSNFPFDVLQVTWTAILPLYRCGGGFEVISRAFGDFGDSRLLVYVLPGFKSIINGSIYDCIL